MSLDATVLLSPYLYIRLVVNVDSTQQKDVDSIYQTALSKLTDEIKRLGWDDWVKIEKKDTSAKIQ